MGIGLFPDVSFPEVLVITTTPGRAGGPSKRRPPHRLTTHSPVFQHRHDQVHFGRRVSSVLCSSPPRRLRTGSRLRPVRAQTEAAPICNRTAWDNTPEVIGDA